MGPSIKKVKDYCVEISEKINDPKNKKLYDCRFGGVFYRDYVDTKKDINESIPLTDDMDNFQREVGKIIANGGGDDLEDWVAGYSLALSLYKNDPREGYKLIIHIADDGAHGDKYSKRDKYAYRAEGGKLDNLIQECSKKKINIVALEIGDKAKESFNRVDLLYKFNRNGGKFYRKEFNPNNNDPKYFFELIIKAIKKVT